MINLVCLKRCYVGRKVWEKGDKMSIENNVKIPDHFAIDRTVLVESEPRKPYDPMRPVDFKLNEPVLPVGGMATGMKRDIVEPMPTAGSEAKKRRGNKNG